MDVVRAECKGERTWIESYGVVSLADRHMPTDIRRRVVAAYDLPPGHHPSTHLSG